ncbi:FAD-dependent oxidoreductase [Jeotgalibacillus proteolyticus]|uniref:Oxidoreductase n=1 Tax=Jeotgalibacillus proteolyticus TaxID=2082395 RepID=A0A2S5GDX6_9BACL|nr:FAD-dependent oxidoreductase [Jeotgalibacillus proteolyticus]PPA71093.1 oxidoreductase [Jeotgalibacillus proteolyticus]
MSFLKDAVAIFKKRELPLVEQYKESDDVYTFLFEKEEDMTWEAGQHGLFTITHKKIKDNTRPFTVASAPSENVVRITSRIGENPSEFKKALLELKPGMKLKIAGPVGSFYVTDNLPALLVAGGIGITPFRSILKQMEADGTLADRQIELLYMDSEKSYVFKEELDALAANFPINVLYLESRDALNEKINKYADLHLNTSNYFIAGPKSMVDSITADLKNKNISRGNIKKDAFYGYGKQI